MGLIKSLLIVLSAPLLFVAGVQATNNANSSLPVSASGDAPLKNLELDYSNAAKAANLKLRSNAVLVVDQDRGQVIYGKNTDSVMPIASITKLMTAMVVLDANLPLEEVITIGNSDVDTLRNSGSRLRVGAALTRRELLRLALMASENRAAAALGRAYPGGMPAFVEAMNVKAELLGMTHSHFVDSTGLHSDNVSTAEDLVKLVNAGYAYNEIRNFTTTAQYQVAAPGARRPMAFRNSNSLVRSGGWQIGLSKTGYISEAGRCLVMQAKIAARSVVIVLLDSWGKQTRIADANRIKRWMESGTARKPRFS
ncbi:MAG: D-alanyl-D-alanine endopeptidase [Pseudomonadota bacterium]